MHFAFPPWSHQALASRNNLNVILTLYQFYSNLEQEDNKEKNACLGTKLACCHELTVNWWKNIGILRNPAIFRVYSVQWQGQCLVPCCECRMQKDEGVPSTIHSWTHPRGSRAEVPDHQWRKLGHGNPAAFRNRKEVLCAGVRTSLQDLQGNTCVVVIAILTPEILLEKTKEPTQKTNHESQTQQSAARKKFKRDACAWKCWGWSQTCFAPSFYLFLLRIRFFQGTKKDNELGVNQSN